MEHIEKPKEAVEEVKSLPVVEDQEPKRAAPIEDPKEKIIEMPVQTPPSPKSRVVIPKLPQGSPLRVVEHSLIIDYGPDEKFVPTYDKPKVIRSAPAYRVESAVK